MVGMELSAAQGKYVQKYFKGAGTVSAEERLRMLSLINNMTFGLAAPSYRTESMHGAGSPQAQKIMIERQSNMEKKKKLARKLAGIEPREDLSD
jgi:4-hydroxybutyryl-CoA dehydratase/vinylacetyl-CoA-Delta-isomerase